ncbi:hypothetical protein HAX54_052353 [Datura stramonium]|uniref:Glycosyltransferase family 2 protein n=1 Tax=Datura stramonium TaxID=4076 RepID=A0ABS8WS88_DATST|nr:hypothetical protein [Datura stramonium]
MVPHYESYYVVTTYTINSGLEDVNLVSSLLEAGRQAESYHVVMTRDNLSYPERFSQIEMLQSQHHRLRLHRPDYLHWPPPPKAALIRATIERAPISYYIAA